MTGKGSKCPTSSAFHARPSIVLGKLGFFLAVLVIALLLAGACAPKAAPSPSPSPSPTAPSPLPTSPFPSPSPTVSPSPPPVKTAGAVAEAGKALFLQNCSNCHGQQGQGIIGPALIGPNAALAKYGTAEGIYKFITVAMPFEAPVSLPKDEYLQILGFLLVQNGFVQPEKEFGLNQLPGIVLNAKSGS